MKNSQKERYSRPPFHRMQRIHHWIKTGKYPNAVTMARDLQVTDRTVKRDIEYMRGRHAAPIEYDELRHGYYYRTDFDFLPVAAMTEAEIFALLVADKAIAQYKGMPFHKPLRMAFEKLTGQLDGQERYTLQDLGRALSFRPFAPQDNDLKSFHTITRAIQERRTLTFQYRKLASRESHTRRVHPYHVACIHNHWYLFAHDVNRKDIRTFVLTRLANPALTDECFVRPKNFDPDKLLEGCFSVMKGEKQEEVVVEFDAWGADLARGRQWHSSQEWTDLPHGGARLKMRLNSLEEVEGWVLSWGNHARVLEPAALRERVKKTAASIAAA